MIKNNILNPIINIDFLVINCKGNLSNYNRLNDTSLTLEKQELGTKIFKNRFFLFHHNEKIATITSDPHSKALDHTLIQIQFENQLFYKYSLPTLNVLLNNYVVSYLELQVTSISRLDISIDFNNNSDIVQSFVNNLLNKNVLLAGRDKSFNTYCIFNRGVSELTGFSVGKRSSSRYLRVYNKSLELLSNPKEYITNKWKNEGLKNENVWRCEYELKNTFFANFLINNNHPFNSIFSKKALIQIFQKAELNHFEIKENTQKSELNKETTIAFFDWALLLSTSTDKEVSFQKIVKIIEPSLLVQKRLLKSTFREYYISKQSRPNSFILQYILEKYKLYDYLEKRIQYYLTEFKNKQVDAFTFNAELFQQHLSDLYYEH